MINSRKIADVCGKRHDHVLRDIRKLNQTYIKNGLPEVLNLPSIFLTSTAYLTLKLY